MDNNSKKTLKNVVSETLIISSIPLIAYASTMAYEAGYNRHFDIPSELITISITNILITVAVVISLGFTIFIFAQGLFGIFGKTSAIPEPISNVLITNLAPWYLLLIISMTAFGLKQWHDYYAIALFAIIWTLIYLLPSAFRKNKNISYTEHLRSVQESEREKFEGSEYLVQNILNSHGIKYQNIGLLFFSAFVFIYSAYGFGKRNAIEQEYFYVNKANPSIVYLRFYSDKIIGAEYSYTDKTTGSLTIEKLPPDGILTIIKQKIGPLKSQCIE